MLALLRRLLCAAVFVACLGVNFTPLAADAAAATRKTAKPKIVTRETFQRGDWHLDIATDTFSGDITCRLHARKKKAVYRMEAVGFRFSKNRDVSSAAYHIGDGPLRRARDDWPDLIARGVPIDRGPPGNASQGIVWVPYAALKQAKAITIQPGLGQRPRAVQITGLTELRDTASARGCMSESSFAE